MADYPSYPEKQRQVLAEYDTSILYNDYVVAKMFNVLNNFDCVAIYLSDHGLYVFDTRNDVAGHANMEDIKSIEICKQIPFVIYMTDKYRQRHSILYNIIKKNQNYAYCTSNLIYTIMDFASCNFSENKIGESLLNENE